MIYTGIDYHKRYSVACTLDAQGNKLSQARIEANTAEGFASYFFGWQTQRFWQQADRVNMWRRLMRPSAIGGRIGLVMWQQITCLEFFIRALNAGAGRGCGWLRCR
jgi:hypothetical protein